MSDTSHEPDPDAVAPACFAHLHLHTEYSALDGGCRVKKIANKAKSLGMSAVGISDHGTMSGVPLFYKEIKAAGLKPILGCEIYVTEDRAITKGSTTWHLGLIAATTEGYYGLCEITSRAYLEGFYYRPRADWQILEDVVSRIGQGHIVALTGCMAAPVMNALFEGNATLARERTERLIGIFGTDNVYGEVQNVGITESIPADSELAQKYGRAQLSQTEANHELAAICNDLGVALIATGDVHYLEESDATPHDAMVCIGTGQRQKVMGPNGTPFANPDRKFSLLPKTYYFRSEADMREALADFPEAIENTLQLAERCDAHVEFGLELLPRYPYPDGFEDAGAYLRHLCIEGLTDRWGDPAEWTDEQTDRLEFELTTIHEMGFDDYFLIVWDLYNEAKNRGIPSGPGRGSAAGAVVAYALGITQLDPLEHGLLFERFLNPGRRSAPDIDMDFGVAPYNDGIDGRKELIEYSRKKYTELSGSETSVAQIITFGTIGAKAGLRDAARVLDYPIPVADRLAKMVPDKPVGISLRETFQQVPEFAAAFKQDQAAKEIITLAGWLEGFVRSEGIHAAGVIIADQPLETIIPLVKKPNGPITTAYEMKFAEAVGLLKMDFLGLRNLDVIWRALEIIRHTEGIDIKDPYRDIPIDDAKTYEMLSRGEAIGVFQFESGGMRGALQLIRPTEFADLVALVALYRPGPMDYIPTYAARKQGRENVTYEDPRLEQILGDTYNVIIYQEQAMMIARELAGFTPSEADDLRKAIGKKLRDLMESLKPQFMDGCVANGVKRDVAERLWEVNEKSADYSFNKSHAACYGFISYLTAYLKANHPHAYMAALLSSVMGTKDKVPLYLQECRRMGLTVLPPDVNRSLKDFSVHAVPDERKTADGEQWEILFGLEAIKKVGENVIDDIRREREARGPFRSLFDLIRRMPHLNKTVLEQLVKAGALDGTGATRQSMLAIVEPALEGLRKQAKQLEKSYVDEVCAAVSDAGLDADQGTQESLLGTPSKRARLAADEKAAVEAVARLSWAGGTPTERDAVKAAREALDKKALSVVKARLRKERTIVVSDELERDAAEEVARGADQRAAQAKQIAAVAHPLAVQILTERQEDPATEALAAAADPVLSSAEFPPLERLRLERDAIGVYASGHPLDEDISRWLRYVTLGVGELALEHDGQFITVCGVVTGKREIVTKKTGAKMAILQIDDPTGAVEATVFPKTYAEPTAQRLIEGDIVVLEAKVEEDTFGGGAKADEEESAEETEREAQMRLVVMKIHPWEPERLAGGPMRITLPTALRTPTVVTSIKDTLSRYPGEHPVALDIDGTQHLLDHSVRVSAELIGELRTIVGDRELVG